MPLAGQSTVTRPKMVARQLKEMGVRISHIEPQMGAVRLRNGGSSAWKNWEVTLHERRRHLRGRVLRRLNKTGILQSDIDYHLIRVSMILIFLLFGFQKWFEYEAQMLIPYQQRRAYFLALSRVRHPAAPGGSWVLRKGCSVHLCSWASGIRGWESLARLGQLSRSWLQSPSFRFMPHGWDPSAGVSGNGRQRPFPHQGRRPSGCIHLLAEAGSYPRVRFRKK